MKKRLRYKHHKEFKFKFIMWVIPWSWGTAIFGPHSTQNLLLQLTYLSGRIMFSIKLIVVDVSSMESGRKWYGIIYA